MSRSRFAPSTTGYAHPGTLLAALLCWLDARASGGRVVLRLENIDPERCRPEFLQAMQRDLAWLGLDWDAVHVQSEAAAAHDAALDALAGAGRLYPCSCSRAALKAQGRRAPDGGFAYDNTCRGRALPPSGWRAAQEPLRARLPEGMVTPRDEGGEDLTQDPVQAFGDPLVRRRDGAVAYQLAVVVDDARANITRVVRGRDIAPSTATQVRLMQVLGYPEPTYRHHLLLLEPRGDKLAKLHGSVSLRQLESYYDAASLVGVLAAAAGFHDGTPATPSSLVRDFAWARVRRDDVVMSWDGRRLG